MVTTKADKRKSRYASAKRTVEDHDKGFTPNTFDANGMDVLRIDSKGTQNLDILPSVAGKNNPHVDEGELCYACTYWVHPRLGPNNEWFTCNRRTFGKSAKCYACEKRAKLAKKGDEDDEPEIEALKTSERQLFYLKHKNGDEPKKTQIFDVAYYGKGQGFGEMLANNIDAMEEDDERLNFFHLSGGATLKAKFKGDKFKGKTYYKPSHMEFVARKKDYPESILDKLAPLDSLIKEADYDEMKAAIEGEEDEDDKKGRKKRKKKGKPRDEEDEEEEDEQDEDEEEDDEEDEESDEEEEEGDSETTADDLGIEVGSTVKHKKLGKCEVVHVSGDGTSLRLKDEDGEVHRAIPPETCKLLETEEEEDEDEDESPKKKGKKKVKKKTKRARDEEDEDEEEEEDEEEDSSDDEEEEEEEDEEEDEEEEEEKPKKKTKKKVKKKVKKTKKKSAKDEDEEDEDEEEDEEEEEDEIPFEEQDEEEDEDEEEEEDEKPRKKKKKARK